MTLAHLDATNHPDLAARDLLRQFGGNLAHVESHIAAHLLTEALRRDDYESYLHWRTVGSLCVELAGDPSRPDMVGTPIPAATARGVPRPVVGTNSAADRTDLPA